ncbi:MAG: M15 family metallopeptidase [Ginsengibacter sp.]|jgi:D-alanyl-D-alanine dipeptidase
MRKTNSFNYCQFFRLLFFSFLFLNGEISFSQSNVYNKNGLLIVKDVNFLKTQIHKDPSLQMVDLGARIPTLSFDLKYATSENFMQEKLYPPITTTFLRKPAADALAKVVSYLKLQGYGIKIWDAYRPYSVTELMWQKIKDPRYVADPSEGSGHNRGISVDLTLINLATLKEELMPTGFDNFTDTAQANFMNLPPQILINREILTSAMEKFGFIQLETEWWHFYLPNSASYNVMDFSFKELQRLIKKIK